jgi:hypothetical protein
VSIYVKKFPGQALGPPFKGKGREGKGKSREYPQIKFYDFSTGLAIRYSVGGSITGETKLIDLTYVSWPVHIFPHIDIIRILI